MTNRSIFGSRVAKQKRKLFMELLENRQLLVTTFGAIGGYVTSDPIYDGVGKITMIQNDGLISYCTGALLPTAEHILTAAHCLLPFGLEDKQSVTVDFFKMGGGVVTRNVIQEFKPSQFTGPMGPGYDIAVFKLEVPVPADIPRYEIYRGSVEIGQDFDLVGFGFTGQGNEGAVIYDGLKRNGKSRFDGGGEAINRAFETALGLPPGSVATFNDERNLAVDFDNGLATNDGLGRYSQLPDIGVGSLEVAAAPRDSGGPNFIGGRLAGVVSGSPGISAFPPLSPRVDVAP